MIYSGLYRRLFTMCFIELVDYNENMLHAKAAKKSTRTRRSKKSAAAATEEKTPKAYSLSISTTVSSAWGSAPGQDICICLRRNAASQMCGDCCAALRRIWLFVLPAYLRRRAAHSAAGWNVKGFQPITIHRNS